MPNLTVRNVSHDSSGSHTPSSMRPGVLYGLLPIRSPTNLIGNPARRMTWSGCCIALSTLCGCTPQKSACRSSSSLKVHFSSPLFLPPPDTEAPAYTCATETVKRYTYHPIRRPWASASIQNVETVAPTPIRPRSSGISLRTRGDMMDSLSLTIRPRE